MKLFHAGFDEIREPDVHHGRVNADFGQGFYLTADAERAYQTLFAEEIAKMTD